MEVLEAEVSVATHEAFQSLTAFRQATESARESLNVLGRAVDVADMKAEELAKAYLKAEQQFKDTGSVADRTRMEELRKTMDSAKDKAIVATKEYKSLEDELKRLEGTQKNVAATHVVAAKDIQQSAEETRKKLGQVNEETGKGSGLLDRMGDSARNMILGFFGL